MSGIFGPTRTPGRITPSELLAHANALERAGHNEIVEGDLVAYRFAKNAREELRAQLREYRGHQLADLRIYVVDELGETLPTKKGIAVRIEQLPHLLAAVSALIAEAERRAA
jgi:cold shock CspA family protein